MASSSESLPYIACADIAIKREESQLEGIGSKIYGFMNPSYTRLLQGELLSIKPKSYKGSDEVQGCAASDPSKTFKVKDSQVSYMTWKEYDILVAIEKPSERWDLFCNKDALQVILTLKINDRVSVSIPTGRHSSGTTGSSCADGSIRYIGVMEQKVGTFFGIELKEPKGTGHGVYGHNRYFYCENCEDNYGIFLSASHLNIGHKKSPSVKIQQEDRVSSGEIGEGDKTLSIGSLVQIHFSDQDMPSYGTIRWIGPLLIKNRMEDIAGVELERYKPGIGNGSWKEVEYFKCDPGYGMFVVLSKLQPDDRYPVHVERGHNRLPDSAPGVLSTMVKDFKQLQEDHRRLITNHNTLESSNQLLVEKVQRLEYKCCGLETSLQGRADDHQKLLQDHAALQTSLAQQGPSLQTAFKKISDLEKTVQEMQPSWSIAPSELQTTKEIIGGGGWGQVTVGYYHGTKVAVKEMYSIIVSDYNRHTFQREMRISSLVRHPNLLLFMGAVTTGNLRIVTEIMDTSLRKIMENGRLTPADIAPIGKDVACALNYLHSRPDPIIHRDVSSANVLLNGKQKGWVAKLGDFGSANFLNKTNTQIPGAQLYSAPEALNSSKGPQGPKMDTYSFGVLLLEMCVCKLPEPAILQEAQQTLHQWDPPRRAVGELGVRCIKPDPDQRPYMVTIIKELE